MAAALHFKDALVGLSLLTFRAVLIPHVTALLCVSHHELISDVSLTSCGYSAAVVVLVDVYSALLEVELSLPYLLVGL